MFIKCFLSYFALEGILRNESVEIYMFNILLLSLISLKSFQTGFRLQEQLFKISSAKV